MTGRELQFISAHFHSKLQCHMCCCWKQRDLITLVYVCVCVCALKTSASKYDSLAKLTTDVLSSRRPAGPSVNNNKPPAPTTTAASTSVPAALFFPSSLPVSVTLKFFYVFGLFNRFSGLAGYWLHRKISSVMND